MSEDQMIQWFFLNMEQPLEMAVSQIYQCCRIARQQGRVGVLGQEESDCRAIGGNSLGEFNMNKITGDER